MADLSITAANVAAGANAQATATLQRLAGTTITAGQLVYAAANGTWLLATGAGTALQATTVGVALHGALAGQPLFVQTTGQIVIGATVVAGTLYYTSVNNPGGICAVGDFATGNYITPIGLGISTTVIQLQIQVTGITHA